MRAAAKALIGEHDFTSFRTAACQARHPIRTVHALDIQHHERSVTIDIRANAFLHNMVRIVTGVLMSVGRGEHDPDWVDELLAARDRTVAAMTVPPHGLYLLGAYYPDEFGLPGPATPGWPASAASAVLC